jgi:hypothetical protein
MSFQQNLIYFPAYARDARHSSVRASDVRLPQPWIDAAAELRHARWTLHATGVWTSGGGLPLLPSGLQRLHAIRPGHVRGQRPAATHPSASDRTTKPSSVSDHEPEKSLKT